MIQSSFGGRGGRGFYRGGRGGGRFPYAGRFAAGRGEVEKALDSKKWVRKRTMEDALSTGR